MNISLKRSQVFIALTGAAAIIGLLCFILVYRTVHFTPVAADQLFNAILEYDTNRVAELLESGVSANSVARSVRRETALIDAVRFGHEDIVQMLLDKGADPNLVDSSRYGALFYALTSPYLSGHPDNLGSDKILAALLARGANIQGRDVVTAMKNIPADDPRSSICQETLKRISQE